MRGDLRETLEKTAFWKLCLPPLITEADLTLAEAVPPPLHWGRSRPHPHLRAESLGWISRQKRKWCGLLRAAWHAEGALGSIILQGADLMGGENKAQNSPETTDL